MASAAVFSTAGTYHAHIERKTNARTALPYYRYVICSDVGQELFDGWAGDPEEANQSIKAHLCLLNAEHNTRVV